MLSVADLDSIYLGFWPSGFFTQQQNSPLGKRGDEMWLRFGENVLLFYWAFVTLEQLHHIWVCIFQKRLWN